MTISGTYSFTVTRDDIIKAAMQNIGKLGEAENPTAQETTDCAFRLNMMVKQWMGKADFAPGLKMWTRKRGDLFLSNTTGRYELGPSGDNWVDPRIIATTTLTAVTAAGASALTVESIAGIANGDYLGIVLDSGVLFWTTVNGAPIGLTVMAAAVLPTQASSGAYVYAYTTKQQRPIQLEVVTLRDYNNDTTPVNQVTLQEYESFPSRLDTDFTSLPSSIYYESQLTNGVLYTDVAGTSDVRYRLHIVYLNPVSDFNNPTDNPEYPQGWYMALVWGLAKQICPMFNAPWTDNMQLDYVEALAMAKEQDGETTAVYFEPGSDHP